MKAHMIESLPPSQSTQMEFLAPVFSLVEPADTNTKEMVAIPYNLGNNYQEKNVTCLIQVQLFFFPQMFLTQRLEYEAMECMTTEFPSQPSDILEAMSLFSLETVQGCPSCPVQFKRQKSKMEEQKYYLWMMVSSTQGIQKNKIIATVRLLDDRGGAQEQPH